MFNFICIFSSRFCVVFSIVVCRNVVCYVVYLYLYTYDEGDGSEWHDCGADQEVSQGEGEEEVVGGAL